MAVYPAPTLLDAHPRRSADRGGSRHHGRRTRPARQRHGEGKSAAQHRECTHTAAVTRLPQPPRGFSYHGRHLGLQGMRVMFVCALASAASLQLACVWACVLLTGHIFAPTAGADKQNPASSRRPAQRQETRPCCLALPRSFPPIGDARCRLRSKACARRAPEIYLRARPRPTAWWQVTTCWSRA